ncbi:hypothetical protein RHOER0001_6737 [Rhodococcus erythropolis SK121]|nr:hypothetical protein RHOER0001_6737 [Rhodococcus erythropolis SK121]
MALPETSPRGRGTELAAVVGIDRRVENQWRGRQAGPYGSAEKDRSRKALRSIPSVAQLVRAPDCDSGDGGS